MVSYTYRMPAGIPGDPNRSQSLTIEAQVITAFGTTGAPAAYGVPVTIDATSGKVRTITTGDAATAVYGFLVRPYPTVASQDALGTSTPPASGVCNVMVRGYMTIKLNGATAAKKDGLVYIRVAAAATGKPIGGVEAAADSSNTVVLPGNSYFMGPADSAGNTEIAFNV